MFQIETKVIAASENNSNILDSKMSYDRSSSSNVSGTMDKEIFSIRKILYWDSSKHDVYVLWQQLIAKSGDLYQKLFLFLHVRNYYEMTGHISYNLWLFHIKMISFVDFNVHFCHHLLKLHKNVIL